MMWNLLSFFKEQIFGDKSSYELCALVMYYSIMQLLHHDKGYSYAYIARQI